MRGTFSFCFAIFLQQLQIIYASKVETAETAKALEHTLLGIVDTYALASACLLYATIRVDFPECKFDAPFGVIALSLSVKESGYP